MSAESGHRHDRQCAGHLDQFADAHLLPRRVCIAHVAGSVLQRGDAADPAVQPQVRTVGRGTADGPIPADELDGVRDLGVYGRGGCETVFVDTSRNGLRAYCSARCGNTDAVRRHREKRPVDARSSA